MNAVKIVAIVLIVAGVLGLLYGDFSFTKKTHEAKLGPLELSVKEKETVTSQFGLAWGRSRLAGRSYFLEAKSVDRSQGSELLVEGYMVHGCVDREGKIVRLPEVLYQALDKWH